MKNLWILACFLSLNFFPQIAKAEFQLETGWTEQSQVPSINLLQTQSVVNLVTSDVKVLELRHVRLSLSSAVAKEQNGLTVVLVPVRVNLRFERHLKVFGVLAKPNGTLIYSGTLRLTIANGVVVKVRLKEVQNDQSIEQGFAGVRGFNADALLPLISQIVGTELERDPQNLRDFADAVLDDDALDLKSAHAVP